MRRFSSLCTAIVFMFGLIALGGSPAQPVVAQGATPEASPGVDCAVTTPDENVALVRRYLEEVYNNKNFDVVDELLADDFAHHTQARPYPQTPGNDDDRAAAENTVTNVFPDYHMTIEDTIASGDEVAVRITATGTQEGPIDRLGVPGTGKKVEYMNITIYRIACGEIAEAWVVTDNLTILRQTGAITDDELGTVGTPTVATPEP